MYTVVAPKSLRTNADYHISVSLYDISAPIEVNATVLGPAHSASTGAVAFSKAESKMLTLAIGDWPEGTYRLQVKGKGANFTTVYENPEQHNHHYGGFRRQKHIPHPITVKPKTRETTAEGFINEVTLTYEAKSVSVFIQTDKAMYKPGQKVQFRAVVVNPSLIPKNNISIDIHIKDGNGNRIIQWTKLYPKNGVISEELQLSDQPVLGDWTIVVEALGHKTTKTFTVAEYVLPTFDVEVVLPTYVTRNRSEVVATVKAIYTYGKAVKGDLVLTVQTKNHYNPSKYRTKTTIDGTATLPVNLLDDLGLNQHIGDSGLEIEFSAQVKEKLTGKQYNRSNTMKIYDRDVKVELIKTSKTYKPGLKYTVLVKVVTQDGKPVAENGPKLKLKYGYSWNEEEWKDSPLLLSPTNGLITVDIFPSKDAESLQVRAEYMGHTYHMDSIQKAESPSGNYIQVIRSNTTDITVGQDVKFIVNATEPIGRLVCEVMGRGDIAWAKSLDIPTNIKAGYELTVATVHQMAPSARILCYYVRQDNQEVVADALNFDVEGVLRTSVTVDTDIHETKPGAMVGVRVNTRPNAFVGILGVDQSVLLLKSGYDISREDVMNELKTYDTAKKSALAFGSPLGPTLFREDVMNELIWMLCRFFSRLSPLMPITTGPSSWWRL
ncbi:unnamed protein product [Medioppia subpectinata]|uniref:TEP1-F n=1 Tax=Medioppia subpectinata TaxID=1979941 RepID=A0A7R9KEL3_9ACAR|nr:unnamed protein product [Medioppia subpectinata]CAG2101909.1 unnamed protein product [Medioppia subpectinata]